MARVAARVRHLEAERVGRVDVVDALAREARRGVEHEAREVGRELAVAREDAGLAPEKEKDVSVLVFPPPYLGRIPGDSADF